VSNSTHKSHRAEYLKVFIVLAVLTAVEIIIPDLKISKFAKGSSLTLLALGKAGIVAWSYMHLKEETKWLRFIALIPVSAFIYAVVVILESLYR
jgi:cytochrome c oxidase subunit 4